MTIHTMIFLQLQGVSPTPLILKLAEKSIVKPVGILEDIVVTIAP